MKAVDKPNNQKNKVSPFPSGLVSVLSQMENAKRQYYRPIYSLHKWWARRPGVTFRAIGMYYLSNEHLILKTKNQKDIFPSIISEEVELDHQSPFFKEQSFSDKVVLDPFMGGGTTLVELARMKAKVIGCDLNPVSWWIVKQELNNCSLTQLEQSYNELENKVAQKILDLYSTDCPSCNAEVDSLYFFWASSLPCANCSSEVFLFTTLFLNKGHKRGSKLLPEDPPQVICPSCLSLNFAEVTSEKTVAKIRCKKCSFTFDPFEGTLTQGKYTCISCNHSEKITSTIKANKGNEPIKLKRTLYAIEFNCDDCSIKTYKEPDTKDHSKYEAIRKEVKTNFEKLLIPKQKIPKGRDTKRLLTHNFEFFHELFNERQLLACSILLNGIKSLNNSKAKELLLTTFSNSLEYNNLLVPYNYPHRKIHHLFTHHAYPVTTRPVENNVWGTTNGAGSFHQVYKRTKKALLFTKKPFEKIKINDSIESIFLPNEKIDVELTSEFNELKENEQSGMLLCQDSRILHQIPSASIDAVITDPPYFNNINYSELSNFFFIWLRLLLKEEYSYFEPEYVPQLQEIVEDKHVGKTALDFQEGITDVLKECNRVLKTDGTLTFTYHHSSVKGWTAIFKAISNSNFEIKSVFPVRSETKFNPHIRNKKAISFDAIIHASKMLSKRKKASHEQLDGELSSLKREIIAFSDQIQETKISAQDQKVFIYSFSFELLSIHCSKYLLSEEEIDLIFDQVDSIVS
ncbi:MAG: DNA methyltransferase [Candidatus Kariarchaeaceae archaeon]